MTDGITLPGKDAGGSGGGGGKPSGHGGKTYSDSAGSGGT